MASDLERFGVELEAWRTKRKLNQAELAQELGVSAGTVYRWENAISGVLADRDARKVLEVTGIEPARARRPPAEPGVSNRLRALEAKVVNLEERLSAVEKRSPPRKRPSASTSKPAAGKTAADLHGEAASDREERLRERQRR